MERHTKHRASWIWTLVFAAGLMTGCTDPDEETLALLTDENDRLLEELETTQADLATAREQVGEQQRENRTLAEQLDALKGQLEAMPDPPENWRGVPGGAMTSIPGTLLFDSGKADLRADAPATLDVIARTIVQTFGDKDIFVFGHTDSQPIRHSEWRDNRQLSFERAAAVIAHLVQRGVSPSQVLAVGAGEHRPLVEGVTSEQRNRRVEIYAVTAELVTGGGPQSP